MQKIHISYNHVRLGDYNLITSKGLQNLANFSGAAVAQILGNTDAMQLKSLGVAETDISQVIAYASIVGLNADVAQAALFDISDYLNPIIQMAQVWNMQGPFDVEKPSYGVTEFIGKIKPLNLRTNAELNGFIEKQAHAAYDISKSEAYEALSKKFGSNDYALIEALGNATQASLLGHDPAQYLRQVEFTFDKLRENRFSYAGLRTRYAVMQAFQSYSKPPSKLMDMA